MQTSIHICPAKPGCELHNERQKELDYVRKELSNQNEKWANPNYPFTADDTLAEIKGDYSTAHGKKMHAKSTPIREAVVVIQANTTMQQLRDACDKCRQKFGIDAMRIYTHRDEGHTAEDGSWKCNNHAHIVFNWYDFRKHTTCKLSRQDMAEMQTLFAEALQMERGVSSDRKHLSAIQQKNKAEAAKLQQTQADFLKQLQADCAKFKVKGNNLVAAFDFLRDLGADPTVKQIMYRDKLKKLCETNGQNNINSLLLQEREMLENSTNLVKALSQMGQQISATAKNIPKFTLFPGRQKKQLLHEKELQEQVKNAKNEAKAAMTNAKKQIAEVTSGIRARELAVEEREKANAETVATAMKIIESFNHYSDSFKKDLQDSFNEGFEKGCEATLAAIDSYYERVYSSYNNELQSMISTMLNSLHGSIFAPVAGSSSPQGDGYNKRLRAEDERKKKMEDKIAQLKMQRR